MAEASLVSGDVVSGLEANELVEIQRVAPFGGKTLVEGVGLQSRRMVKRPLAAEELAALVKVRGQQHTFDGDARLFLLGAEAERIRIAHQFDPLFAVNSSIVDPLPHQVEAVYRYLLPLPRIRFLLADDTGAGKTIMTGLLIKELLFRGVLQKILIITPGGLTKQWKEEELQEKFGLYARLVNRASFEAEPGQFSRYEEGIFVTSIDFLARNEGCLKAASETQWDLVVVDEAHKLSAYEYGTKLEESERYKAVKALAHKTDHLLFLTATPHRGRKDTFRRLLLLLDEDLFQKDEHVADRVREQAAPYGVSGDEDFEDERPISKARNRFFLRRLKEEMVDWDNNALFKDRHTKTTGYDLTPEEKTLYDEVTSYVRSKRKEAKAKRNRNVELTLMVMQRRLASSLYAITRTLENRLRALNEVLSILRDPSRSEAEKKRLFRGTPDPSDPRDITEYEDLTEEERERIDQRIFRQVLTDDPDKVEEERDEVERLFRLADSLKHHKEAKFAELLAVLDSSDVIRAEDEKLLIFTEHRDTLNRLAERLEEKGYSVATIHGGMDVDSRKQAQRQFRTRAKIMVATDAAGEGINLQFCRYLINWDIPWNPNRLEQRMGRIHRYGQAGDVWVYNLVAQNTREGSVLQKVLSKLDVMREQMGSDRVYDVIDEWLEDVPLVRLIESAIDNDDESASARETDAALTTASNERAERLMALQKKTSLASRLDLKSARELRDASDERRLQPLFIQRFFERAWTACGGTVRKDLSACNAQAGDHFPVWHIAFDPYRITVPLKRKGPRGSGQWQPIGWEQLIREVCDGGKIFADTGDPASADLEVMGFKGLYTKRNELMDPNAPELGHRTNGYVFQGGRIVGSLLEFARRFGYAFGTVNTFEHVNVCELSHHVATDQVYPGKHMTQPDIVEAKFIIYWGTQPGDANFPMQTQAKYAAEARAKSNGLKYVVVDPHLGRGGVNGGRADWVPIKPGTDGALALAMIRWIIAEGRYDADYLSRPTQAAAEAAGELSHTDASHLVVVDATHPARGRFLHAADAGLPAVAKGAVDRVVIGANGAPARAVDTPRATIEYSGTVNGIAVKSAFTLLRESAERLSIAQYAEICGVGPDRIESLAREFTSYGRQAVSTMYRGVVKHPNGYYNGVAVLLLNLLVGNLNWTGGLTVGGGSYDYKKGRYNLVDIPEAKGLAYGVPLSRERVRYEDSSEFKALVKPGKNPYPAKRPWFPFSFEMYTELLPSGLQRYPYGIDILVWHMATPFYSVPTQGNEEIIGAVKDPKKIPLIIASDIVIGDTSMYADYIIPDGSFLERWCHIGVMPTVLTKGTGVRWPVVHLTEKTSDGRRMCLEEFFIDVAKRLGMPGYGDTAIRASDGKWWPLHRREDWFLKANVNVATAKGVPGDEVPPITDEELAVMDLASFREEFKDALPEDEWPIALGIMARGGRFEPAARAREGARLTHRFDKTLHFYAEDLATTINSMTGKPYLGTTTWVEPATALGTPLDKLDDPKQWPLTIITKKGALQSHSRLSSNYVLRQIMPDNGVQIAAEDARRFGIANGDKVWVVTPHGRRQGTARVIQGIRPGVITFNVGYGHWGYGASNYHVGGKPVAGDRVRRMGIHLNPIMRRDPDVWQMSLMDLPGGSVVFYNTRARLEKVAKHA